MATLLKTRGPQTQYTEKELINQLQKKAIELDRTPTAREAEQDERMADTDTFQNWFGSWSDAVKVAGLIPNHINPKDTTKGELQKQLRDLSRIIGRSPTVYEVSSSPLCFDERYFIAHFGSITAAIESIGKKVYHKPTSKILYSDDELLNQLRNLAERLGHTPGQIEIREDALTANPLTYHRRFGSLTKAKELADLDNK